MRRAALILLVAFSSVAAHAAVTVTFDHNRGAAATPAFKFERVPSPSNADAASSAEVKLIASRIDTNAGPIESLTDGKLPGGEDEPGSNLFFGQATWGGRFRIDLRRSIAIAAINTYSWHTGSRAPQLYKVYGSNGEGPNFDPAPKSTIDPPAAGWSLIGFVDTRPEKGPAGGQYGVSLTDPTGVVGRYRYLLFDVFETESNDDWGNTFYSEVDVVER